MAIYLDIDPKTRATTSAVMAALEDFLGRLLYGPRQHVADLRWSLGPVSFTTHGERVEKR